MRPYVDFVSSSDSKERESLLLRVSKLRKSISDGTSDLIEKAYLLKFLYKQSAYEENEAEEGYSHSKDSIRSLNNNLDNLEAELKTKYGDIDYFHYIDQVDEFNDDIDKLEEHIGCLDGLSMLDGNVLFNYDIRISEYEVKCAKLIKLIKN